MYECVALGELLIDFTPAGISSNGNLLFERNPGGAPANVAVCLANLGRKTALISKVGNDEFGHYLRDVLIKHNVSIAGLVSDTENKTTLAFVHLTKEGERSFSFYRKPGADSTLHPEEVMEEVLRTKLFHFGSLSLTNDPARSATWLALRTARKNKALVSFDPNLRLELWPSQNAAKDQIFKAMRRVDVVKVSLDELRFLTGSNDLALGSNLLMDKYGITALFVTLGAIGCYYRVGRLSGMVPGFKVRTIDSTGAGDAFFAGILYMILEEERDITRWEQSRVQDAVRFANAIGALVTTRKGAIPAMPNLSEVEGLLRDLEERDSTIY